MARPGLYKADVQRARSALLAAGKKPTLDAVRIELGNTGSRSTISKYLNELQLEDPSAAGSSLSLSEPILEVVEKLTVQLRAEAERQIEDFRAQSLKQVTEANAKISTLERRVSELEVQLATAIEAGAIERTQHSQTKSRLHASQIEESRLSQHANDLMLALEERAKTEASLETNLENLRAALEHFRQASQQQREDLQRRHDSELHQMQLEVKTLKDALRVKQEEAGRLSNEGVRTHADLDHERKNATRLKEELRVAEGKLKDIGAARDALNAQLAEAVATNALQSLSLTRFEADLTAANSELERARDEKSSLQQRVAQAEATLAERVNVNEHLEELIRRLSKISGGTTATAKT